MKLRIVFLSLVLSLAFAACGKEEDMPDDGNYGSSENSELLKIHPSTQEINNTKYCVLNNQKVIVSNDNIQVKGKDQFHGVGGGCVKRPIREVWAVILNHSYMKDDDIRDYVVTPRTDLVNPKEKTYFAFDIESKVTKLAGAVNVKWLTEWFHSVNVGTYKSPKKISINFQKIEGDSRIKIDQESYILDQVTPQVTSFLMSQILEAPQVDVDRVKSNIEGILQKVRTGPPDWSVLNKQSY